MTKIACNMAKDEIIPLPKFGENRMSHQFSVTLSSHGSAMGSKLTP